MQARDVMTSPVISVEPTASVRDIGELLLAKKITAVPVVDRNGQLIGIVSEGDLLRRIETRTERARPSWLELLLNRDIQANDYLRENGPCASDVMSTNLVTVAPEADLTEIAQILDERRIKRVPVLENGKVVGIVSRADLLRALVAYRKAPSGFDTRSDPELRRLVENRIAELGWVDPNRLNVVVTDGIAHLWGPVESEQKRRALLVAAEGVPGVAGVEDHLSRNWFANESG